MKHIPYIPHVPTAEPSANVPVPEAGLNTALARRRLLYGLGAVASAPVLASCVRVQGTPQAKAPAGATSALRISRTSAPGTAVHRTDFPITAVGVSWTGAQKGVRVRLYDEAGRPGAWEKVTAGCPCGADSRSPRRTGAVPTRAFVPGGNSYGYQIDAPADVDVIEAVAVDAGPSPRLRPQASQEPGSSALVRTAPAPVTFPPEGLVRRADWGADESKRFGPDGRETTPPQFFPVQALTVHHTVTANDDPDPAATVRAIYALHATSNGWGDIGYHFLIDARGHIYEGRWSGRDGVPAHDARSRVVTGFHTVGFNSGNIGIALLGDFTKAAPSRPMHRSLTRLLASLARLHGLDPQAAVTYRNPLDGRSKRGMTVSGHRDWTSTECPGGLAHASLRGIRAEAGKLLAGD
ncbi:N-acetylmuramoyl-L-alanine amidase [Streptomyces olivaceoviridis]